MTKQEGEGPKTLADVQRSLQEDPPAPPRLRLAWNERRVSALPTATRQYLMPVVGGPGTCWVAVAPGQPVPPGAEDMDRMTAELMELWEQQQCWEGKPVAEARIQQTLAKMDEIAASLAEQRQRVLEEQAALEELEPVELDWPAMAARIIKLSGYEPLPTALREGPMRMGDGSVNDADPNQLATADAKAVGGRRQERKVAAAVRDADRIVATQRAAGRLKGWGRSKMPKANEIPSGVTNSRTRRGRR